MVSSIRVVACRWASVAVLEFAAEYLGLVYVRAAKPGQNALQHNFLTDDQLLDAIVLFNANCAIAETRFEGAAVPFAHWHATSPGPIFSFGLGGTGQMIPAVTAMVTDLLFERFPRLKIASVEAGCGYAPYLMDRLDAKHEAFRALVNMPKKPSEYIKQNCYFVAEPRERTIEEVLRLVGEDRVVWGSDYPHVDAVGFGPDGGVRMEVLQRNAAQLFGIR